MEVRMASQTDDSARQHDGSALAGPHLEFDLPAEIARLKAEPTWSAGHSARTIIKYDDLRVVLLAMNAGHKMAEHKAEGRISVHVLSGHIAFRTAERTFDLRAGGLIALDRGVPHDVTALEESAFLLTIAWPGRA
jgi:quercetin dioxygenase-like cupin family protein